ncbi:cephalosporin hydroxylase family protein [Aurantimonas sp. C2-6-R+9]|uniref:cephalosporin hydroxylase family protein n=1 Tax=unclassified Aurantimonas TaxID=2638230 RepID=UPI002E177F9F|nr:MULTISPECIES: cephalosporin hydroxylase family protein [unclassified Aurantimonas]MEC5291203.1 cephalosporin hydroxylase family protein [Aurantimonas sp. C2-3-R2]MEC5380978.1 cephalosporin hydroxylase family protein [Aurantimonas sp. C2-6-R+9]MEC5412306.1 cephalosporin hydroxylase family protein [Aurantimonas sp. C2-4-R8]
MDPAEQFRNFVASNIRDAGEDRDFIGLSNIWIREAIRHRYAQNFSWLGRPIIQVPQDIYAIQELIWACRPDLIVETGIAHGGSLIMSASMLALLDYCDAVEAGTVIDPKASRRKVVGVDIDIRAHNREGLDAHPLRRMIHLLEGSSISRESAEAIYAHADGYERVMVFLDSNHTHAHVLEELELYAPLTSKGCYCVVWDSGVENLPADMCADRPWGKGNNPKTAVWEYMEALNTTGRTGRDGQSLHFEIDKDIEHKLMITASPDGFLRRV